MNDKSRYISWMKPRDEIFSITWLSLQYLLDEVIIQNLLLLLLSLFCWLLILLHGDVTLYCKAFTFSHIYHIQHLYNLYLLI